MKYQNKTNPARDARGWPVISNPDGRLFGPSAIGPDQQVHAPIIPSHAFTHASAVTEAHTFAVLSSHALGRAWAMIVRTKRGGPGAPEVLEEVAGDEDEIIAKLVNLLPRHVPVGSRIQRMYMLPRRVRSQLAKKACTYRSTITVPADNENF